MQQCGQHYCGTRDWCPKVPRDPSHTVPGRMSKTNLFVKEILFALRVKDIHVVLPAMSVMAVSTHHFRIVSVGLQEFTVLNISDVTEGF